MKYIVSFLIAIVFLIFITSLLLINTEWLDSYVTEYKQAYTYDFYLGYIKLYSSLVLLFFVIAQAKYSLLLKPTNRLKEYQLQFGVALLALVIFKLLAFSFISEKMLGAFKHDPSYTGTLSAQKTIGDAWSVYVDYGVKIEYYDCNKTVQKFIPSPKIDDIRETMKETDQLQKFYEQTVSYIPYNITLAFLTLIFSFLTGSYFAKRKMELES